MIQDDEPQTGAAAANDPPPAPVRRDIALEAAEPGGQDDDSWILSYVDLFTLLVVMFVVMLSFSAPRQENAVATRAADTGTVSAQDQLLARFQQQLAGLVEQGQLAISASAAGISLQLEEEILFDSGTARLLGQGEAVLNALAPALMRSGQAVTVEGHTDNRPIATARFPSNWELSGARAAQVVRHLIRQGLPAERLRAIGYADTRPVADNSSPAGRARNRRVTLLVKAAQ
ncbi:hypothetical protein Tel_15740 [Candidatus Tenderia electrophaga]|jgi:chemotaxis protein MotB|uniref:OmpA-like domain-containing protein n=1 Tax=Candidatus Tenderia electrophaga TaxID=1748243 RepID=A0A0S2TH76_9GAMM|nr:hypothetical protein Tel_15740 [Candidatus Tenderia electrophaga]